MPRKQNEQPLADLARRMMGLLKNFRDRSLSQLGLTASQFLALSALAEAEQALTMSQLAERLHMSRPGLSYLVERLVEAGLAERSYDPHDRRVVAVSVTPQGRVLVAQFTQLRNEQLSRVASRLGPLQRAHLIDALTAFVAAWEAQDAPAQDTSARSAG
jgi:DNA-binding MarR family transcriptional regulator